jgi:hypothetical protein
VAQGIRAVAEKLSITLSLPRDVEGVQKDKNSKENIAVRQAEIEIEITIKHDFDTYTNADQSRLLHAIQLFLEMEEGEIKITKKRRGSVKLTLNLPRDKAEALFRAIKSGQFEEYGAVDAELKRTDVQAHSEFIINLAREVVSDIAPQELPLFRIESTAYLETSPQMLKSQSRRDDIFGFGTGPAVTFLTPIVLAVVTEAAKFLVQAGIKTLKDWRGKAEPQLSSEQMTRLRERIVEVARELNLRKEQEQPLAESVLKRLTAPH